MRAAVCPEHGTPDVIRVEEVPSPEAGVGQVRVSVSAASVNFPDVLLIADEYQLKVPAPFIPGSEFCGTVVEVGDGVDTLSVGDRVAGTGIIGAFAEEVVASIGGLWRVPDGVGDRAAAAFGVAHRTAYHVLRSVAELQQGDDLVVLGAGGGVGLAAVQLGALLGATVTAVASSNDKLHVAAECGATHVIDHRQQDLRSTLKEVLPGGADVVVDPVGGDLSEAAYRGMAWRGRFVTVGFAAGTIPRIPLNLVLLKGAAILGFQFADFGSRAPDEMARNETELLDLLASGQVSPHIGAVFSLDQAAEALHSVADGKAIGKVVIDIGPEVT